MAGMRRRSEGKKNRLRSWGTSFFLVLIFIVGLGLIFNSQIKDWLIQQNTEKYAIGNVSREEIEKNEMLEGNFDFDQVESMTTADVLKDQFSSSDFPVVGAVAVPDAGINLPIFKGVEYNQLFYGAGTTDPEQVMGEGNYGLASHRAANMDLLFSPLEKARDGQLIYLTDLAHVYSYEIYSIQRVQQSPENGSVLNKVPGRKIVTLVTCGNADGTVHLVVQGELRGIISINEISGAVADAFNLKKNTY